MEQVSETEKPGVLEMINTSTGTYNTITWTNISVLQEIIYTKSCILVWSRDKVEHILPKALIAFKSF